MCYSLTLSLTRTKPTRTQASTNTHATLHFTSLAAICLSQSNLLKLFIFYYAVYLLTDAFGTSAFHHQRQPTGKMDTLASKIDKRMNRISECVNLSLDFLDRRHRRRSIFGIFFIILFSLFCVSRVAA